MVTASPSPPPSLTEPVGSIFNATDWETVSFKVEMQTFYAPRFKFVQAKMCPGKENPVLVALRHTTSTKYAINVDKSITAEDFETLLGVMYPTTYDHLSADFKGVQLTKEKWISVLKISSLWFYQDLRGLALQHLEKLTTFSNIEKVVFGRTYFYPDWVTEGLEALSNSHTLLNSQTSKLLGNSTTLRIHQIRERKEYPEARKDTDDGVYAEVYNSVNDDVKSAFTTEMEALETSFQEFGIPHPIKIVAPSAPSKVSQTQTNLSTPLEKPARPRPTALPASAATTAPSIHHSELASTAIPSSFQPRTQPSWNEPPSAPVTGPASSSTLAGPGKASDVPETPVLHVLGLPAITSVRIAEPTPKEDQPSYESSKSMKMNKKRLRVEAAAKARAEAQQAANVEEVAKAEAEKAHAEVVMAQAMAMAKVKEMKEAEEEEEMAAARAKAEAAREKTDT